MASRSMDFWNTHARPNYEEYKRDRSDLRRAMNAALSAFHMADYVFTEYLVVDRSKLLGHTDLEDYRSRILCVECQDFKLLKAVANAHKHLWTGPMAQVAQGVFDRSSTQNFADSTTVFTNDEAGHPVDFRPVLDSVMAMWERLFDRHQF